MVGLILRSFRISMVRFVKPHLEQGRVIWTPYLKKHITIPANVQRRVTEPVDGYKILNYTDRLKRLDLTALAQGRARGDTIEIYQLFHSYGTFILSKKFKSGNCVSQKHVHQLEQNILKNRGRGVQNKFLLLPHSKGLE